MRVLSASTTFTFDPAKQPNPARCTGFVLWALAGLNRRPLPRQA